MALQKMQNSNAFLVRDLDTETPAIGIVRSANKILQGGAKELARSQTYQCAAFEMKYQGASAGVNAPVEERDGAIAAFADELLEAVTSGSLMLDPAKGVSAEQLASLTAADGRPDIRLQDVEGRSMASHLSAMGAVACAAKAKPLDGAKVAIENFDQTGAKIAELVAGAGGKVVGISTGAGAALSSDGFDPSALTSALASDGADMINALADEETPFWRILGADADILFAGSKMGLIDHKGAENVKASVLVPTGSIPYTTKGALVMERQGVTVLPDFITTGGSLLASFAPDGASQASLEAEVTSQLGALTESVLGKEASPILEACYKAEAFLKTWRDELPFGRPFA